MTKIESQCPARRMKERVKYILNRLFRSSQRLLEFVPYKENRVCCITCTRKGYVDNLRAVSQELLRKGGMEIIWITKYPETCVTASDRGIKVVRYHTAKHFYLQFTARIILSDDSLYHGLIKRKEQIYLNVWHGGINYKQLGKEGISFEDPLMEKIFERRNPSPDYMIAGSRFFAENMKAAFGFDRTVFLESGLPRNDILFHDTRFRGKVKRFYGICGKNVILYAPTFREEHDMLAAGGVDFGKLAEAGHRRYGGEWVVLYRAHYFVQEAIVCGRNVIDVSGYDNMQEILIDTDLLISDYSSCMWDYSFLYRPIIVYAPDEERYCRKERGLTAAGRNMPYPKAACMEELLAIMENHDFTADVERIKAHHREMGAFDTGCATKYVTDFILSKMRVDEEGTDEESDHIRNF